MTAQQAYDLGRQWYAGRFEADWEPFSVPRKEAILDSVGLGGDFWRLTPEGDE
jgi:hypothetical protein